jgi:hypothetical protein
MSEASTTFDQELRAVVLARLRDHGFAFDGSRTFRRALGGGAIAHVVNFQLGQRSLQGRFAVNLGVYVEGDAGSRRSGASLCCPCSSAPRTCGGASRPTTR